jgi:hypothetical protein
MVRAVIGKCLVLAALVTAIARAQEPISFRLQIPDTEVGSSPNAVATGDFNNDQKTDLAVANMDSDDVSVLLGKGDGTFKMGLCSNQPTQLCDLDNECPSAGPCTLLRFPVGSSPVAIAVGDFDHNGTPDIITANDIDDTVSVLLNQGGAMFDAAVSTDTGSSPESVVVGDFDGDDFPDVATADLGDDTVTILKGAGDGSFTQPLSIAVGASPQGLAAGLLDGDALVDLVVTNSEGGDEGTGTITVLKGLGGDDFEAQPEIPLNCGQPSCVPVGVAVAKLDADDTLDLAVINEEGCNVSILLGFGDLTFSPGQNIEVAEYPAGIAVEDFSGDGKPDIATSGYFEDKISVLEGLGDGTFWPAVDFDVGAGPVGIAAGKFNADDKNDLATTNQATGNENDSVSILLNTTGTITCAGDCNADEEVTVDELTLMVNIALENPGFTTADCEPGDVNMDGAITIDELTLAVNSLLDGCPA